VNDLSRGPRVTARVLQARSVRCWSLFVEEYRAPVSFAGLMTAALATITGLIFYDEMAAALGLLAAIYCGAEFFEALAPQM